MDACILHGAPCCSLLTLTVHETLLDHRSAMSHACVVATAFGQTRFQTAPRRARFALTAWQVLPALAALTEFVRGSGWASVYVVARAGTSGARSQVFRARRRRVERRANDRATVRLFVNWADFPSLVVLDGGRLAAHWLQRNGSGTYAYGVRIRNRRRGKNLEYTVVRIVELAPNTDCRTLDERGTVARCAGWTEIQECRTRRGKRDDAFSTTVGADGTRAPKCGWMNAPVIVARTLPP